MLGLLMAQNVEVPSLNLILSAATFGNRRGRGWWSQTLAYYVGLHFSLRFG